MECHEINEDTRAYYSSECMERVLFELFHNSYRTIRDVYVFNNFDEYIYQLKSDKNEDKKEIYWNTAYYQKLTDYVKISIAFENFNKAELLLNGYLVHKIQKSSKNTWYKNQITGNPIRIDDFKEHFKFIRKSRFEKAYLDGLQNNFPTINYSQTLNENYQKVIKLDKILLSNLKEINEKRNRLHFFTDFKGAFEINSHIEKWKYIKDLSINTIEEKLKKYKSESRFI